MAWDAKRKSHQGLMEAGYRGPHVVDTEHPAECQFCKRPLVWYITPAGKVQPFTASSFEPHHGDCLEYAQARKRQKAQAATDAA